MAVINLMDVTKEIDQLSGLKFSSLSFPSSLEDQFETDTSARRCSRLWLEGLFAIVFFDLLLIVDHFFHTRSVSKALVIRLGIVTPIALLVNFSMLYRPNKYFREISITFVACIAGLSQLYLGRSHDPVSSAYTQSAIIAVILFTNILMRLRLSYAIAVTTVLLLGDTLFLELDTFLSREQKVLGLCLTFGIAVVTLISNYSFSREERLNYLLCLQGEMMIKELNRSNVQLQAIAERDSLTGLANRHFLDVHIAQLWEDAHKSQSKLSVILVDVDHFKVVNDEYGHLYGDKVLRRIAHLIAEALRRKDDLAARFGGEEFVVVLPDTDQPSAVLVAERLRRLVETAGFPAFDNPTNSIRVRATVSCGVATAYPASPAGFQSLLNEADLALYEAKATGRNRVCCSSSASLLSGRNRSGLN